MFQNLVFRFLDFLSQLTPSCVLLCRSFVSDYAKFKKAIHAMASLDCVLALADVAKQASFCRYFPTKGKEETETCFTSEHFLMVCFQNIFWFQTNTN